MTEHSKKENKKIQNAVATTYNNIDFKSKLEVSCYKKLEASGLSFKYESDKIVLWEGENIKNILVYEPNLAKQLIPRKVGHKLINITYTPDFKVLYKNYVIYFDVKGHINDVYPIKKKMFIQLLNKTSTAERKFMFFEPHTVKQMLQAITIIKNL